MLLAKRRETADTPPNFAVCCRQLFTRISL